MDPAPASGAAAAATREPAAPATGAAAAEISDPAPATGAAAAEARHPAVVATGAAALAQAATTATIKGKTIVLTAAAAATAPVAAAAAAAAKLGLCLGVERRVEERGICRLRVHR
jgi:hypothetical protein